MRLTNYLRRILAASFLMLSIAGLQGCGEPDVKKGSGAGKYGMMDANTPEFAAIKFFEYIYHDQDISRVLSFCSPTMARLVKSYRSNRNVQRHILNLTYDEVEITVDTGNSVGRNEFAEDATVTLFFSGLRNGDRYEDMRIVELKRLNKHWKVHKVQPDKFL